MGYQYQGGQGAQGKSKLIIGPWTHGGAKKQGQGQLLYPDNCIDNFSGTLFWNMVNEYVRNQPGDYDDWPPVYYYVMGDVDDVNAPGNEWRSTDNWPPQSTDINWYFHENGELSREFPSNYNPLTYNYDPENPVPTVGGQNLKIPPGPYDQAPIENRDDVLVFTSDVLNEPFEATGAIKAKLYVSSDCPDTDFTVKLTDVYPNGRSMLITDGILRMRNRNGPDHWEFMQPGNIYEVEIDLWSTSYVWNTGHKIRVAISSSNYPRFLNNPNTDDPVAKNNTYNIAQNTVYLDDNHPSCIILPKINPDAIDTDKIIQPQLKADSGSKDSTVTRLIEFIKNKIRYTSGIMLDPFTPLDSSD
jgi:putative CocE/NonD family hydrolase